MKKTAKRLFAGIALALVSILVFPTAAFASLDGGSGGGDGRGGSGNGATVNWRSSDSMADFERDATGWGYHSYKGIRWSDPKSYARSIGISEHCNSPNLVRIYWLQFQQSSNVAKNDGGIISLQPGNHPRDNVYYYARDNLNGNQISLMCVTQQASNQVVESFNAYSVRTVSSSDATVQREGVYANTATAAPQPIFDEDGNPYTDVAHASTGTPSMNAQSSSTKTHYGDVVDEILRNKPTTVTQIKNYERRLDAAIANDGNSSAKNPENVNLNQGNREGLAKGGILNITESSLNMGIWMRGESTTYRVVYRQAVRMSQTGWQWRSGSSWQPVTSSSSPATRNPGSVIWTTTIANGKRNVPSERAKYTGNGQREWTERSIGVNDNPFSQQTTGFYQILGAHCNADGLNRAMSANSGITERRGAADDNYSLLTTAVTTNSNGDNTVFGNREHSNSSLQNTAYVAFFDKECAFECVANPTGANVPTEATGNVISTSTGTGENKVRRGIVVDGDWNSNFVEVVRDNEEATIQPNVWYPKRASNVQYGGESPHSSTIVNWSKGTPNKDGEVSFTYIDSHGKKVNIFNQDGTATAAPNQKNDFLTSSTATPLTKKQQLRGYAYKNKNSAQLAGAIDEFYMKASWASEANAPLMLNIKHHYSPNYSTPISTSLGFSSTGAATVGGNTSVSVPIDTACYTLYGANIAEQRDWLEDTETLFRQNTGTGTANNMDRDLLSPQEVVNINNLVVKYVRVTGE